MNSAKIVLKENYSRSDIIHFVIEKCILCKWQTFKNNPRGNNLILRALWISIFLPMIFLVFLIVGKMILEGFFVENLYTFFNKSSFSEFNESLFSFKFFKNYLLPWLGLNLIIYANLWKDYHSKWSYCSSLYNEIIKQNCEKVQRNLISNFAIDLLCLDMWAHRSFYSSFRNSVEEAIEHKYQDCQSCQITKLNSGNFSENEIAEILEDYQSELVENKVELEYSCSCCKS